MTYLVSKKSDILILTDLRKGDFHEKIHNTENVLRTMKTYVEDHIYSAGGSVIVPYLNHEIAMELISWFLVNSKGVQVFITSPVLKHTLYYMESYANALNIGAQVFIALAVLD